MIRNPYFLLLLHLLLLIGCHRIADGQESGIGLSADQKTAIVREAIADLKSASFGQRRQAIETLRRFPEQALSELENLGTEFDAEFSLQVQRLTIELQQTVISKVLDEFVQQRPSQSPESTAVDWQEKLPLWNLFAQQLGDRSDSRKLYAAAFETHWAEFKQIQKDTISVSEFVEEQLQKESVHARSARLLPATAATLLLLANDSSRWGKSGMDETMMADLENRLAVNSVLFRSGKFSKINRQLLSQWCKNRSVGVSQFGSYHSFLQLAIACQVNDAFPRLILIVQDSKTAGYARGTALIYAIALAGPDDLPQFEPLLNDRTVVANPPPEPGTNRKVECLICDYALLALAIHSGMDLEELGFRKLVIENLLNIDRNKIGFASEEERKAAISKWRSFDRQQKASPKFDH